MGKEEAENQGCHDYKSEKYLQLKFYQLNDNFACLCQKLSLNSIK